MSVCLNCAADLHGPYCAQCGQRAQDPDPTLRELLAEAWDAFANVDGRVLSSLRLLLLRPGVLTAEYLRGRRARYLAPLRLYLLCSVGALLLTAIEAPANREPGRGDAPAGVEGDSAEAASDAAAAARRDSVRQAALRQHGLAVAVPLDPASVRVADSLRVSDDLAEEMGAAPAWLRARLARGVATVTSDTKGFGERFKQQLPRLMFVLMPVFGLLLALAYRSRRRRYPVHLIVALHLHAFFFAALAADAARAWLPWSPGRRILKIVIVVWMLVYPALALRQVYGGRLRWAVARAALLATEYAVVGAVAVTVLATAMLLVF